MSRPSFSGHYRDHGFGRWSRREIRRRTVGLCFRAWVSPLHVQRLGFLSTSHGVGRYPARTWRNHSCAAAAVPVRRAVAPHLASSRYHDRRAYAEPSRVPRQLRLTVGALVSNKRDSWLTGLFEFGADAGRIRTYNPAVNSKTACSRLTLQTQDLAARRADYCVNLGDSGGTPTCASSLRRRDRTPDPG